MPATVIITRPLAQAQPLAERVAALGRPVEVLPLLEIAPLADSSQLQATLAQLSSYALVAFVSPNAIDAAFAHIPAWPAGVTAAVVGEGSRAALAAHGVTDANAHIASPANPAHADTEHLLQALDLKALRGARVLIVRGESGRELMGDAFRAAGADVTVVAAYRRSTPALTPALGATLERLLAQPADWVITSSEALRGLLQLAGQLPGGPDAVVKLQQQHLIVPHARIAQTANGLGFHSITQTGSGDERLLAALQSRP
jgi:uroporphyrinogen-III synthase